MCEHIETGGHEVRLRALETSPERISVEETILSGLVHDDHFLHIIIISNKTMPCFRVQLMPSSSSDAQLDTIASSC